jgi:DNA-binding beta-propeller fold protein YncE
MRLTKAAAGLLGAMLLAACTHAAEPIQASSATLLIGNKGEDTVSFVNLATGNEIARLPTGRMPHEIAVSPDGRQAAVVSYGARGIDIFDVPSRTKLRTIDLSPNEGPHGIVWLEDGRLIVTTERSQSLTIVDTRNGDAVSAVKTDQQGSHMVAVSPDKRFAYTANIPADTVTVIDLHAGKKVRDLEVGGRPEGITLTGQGRILWVGDLQSPRVQAYDTRTFERLAEIATGPVPIRVLASPDERWVVTSNIGNGSLTVIDAASRKALREIAVGGSQETGQVTILFSPDGRRIYAAETGRDQVAEIDFETGKVLRRLPAGRNGDGLAIAH